MHNQLAELTDVLQGGVFTYTITNQTDTAEFPSVVCRNWIDDQLFPGKAFFPSWNSQIT